MGADASRPGGGGQIGTDGAVAGDVSDFIEIGPDALGILVADVMGHGIPAALVSSMVRLAFAAQAEPARDPALVLRSKTRSCVATSIDLR
jgi:serine phosphatase RsbU (regulator of sigma subunit)